MTEADKIIAACDAIGLKMTATRRPDDDTKTGNAWTICLERADGRSMRYDCYSGSAVVEAIVPDIVFGLVVSVEWFEDGGQYVDMGTLERIVKDTRAFFGDDFDSVAALCENY